MPCLSLLYHRVNELSPDPWTLCVSPKHFAEQMEIVARLSPRPIVTFDDGYADNLYQALPVLERHNVSARFFVLSGALGIKTEMWWDALDRLFPEQATYMDWFHRLRQLSYEAREQELDALFATRKLSRQGSAERRMLTQEELTRLAASRLAEIGAHTVTHPVLSQLQPEAQEEEIVMSKRQLEDLLDSSIDGFAYPNGTDADYTRLTVEIVRRAGFSYAYSAFEHRRSDPFQLPRVMIRNWDGDEFAKVLAAAVSGFV